MPAVATILLNQPLAFEFNAGVIIFDGKGVM